MSRGIQMEYTFDDIVEALKKDDDWPIPEDIKDTMLAGAAKSLLGA